MNTKTTQPDPTAVAEGYRYCEKIAGRNIPNLYLAARFFDQPALFDAFCATYASMRIIDDRIDGLADREKLTPEEKEQAMAAIGDWLGKVNAAFALKPVNEPQWLALADTFSKFDLPMDPW
jgi:phytoene/squalene synthetase